MQQSLRIVDVLENRVLFDVGWGLIRASNTQPILVLRFEAQTESRLADIRYKGGVSCYLEVLDSERQFFDAELGLVRAQRDELLAVVRLYRALGGGWQE